MYLQASWKRSIYVIDNGGAFALPPYGFVVSGTRSDKSTA